MLLAAVHYARWEILTKLLHSFHQIKAESWGLFRSEWLLEDRCCRLVEAADIVSSLFNKEVR